MRFKIFERKMEGKFESFLYLIIVRLLQDWHHYGTVNIIKVENIQGVYVL